MPCIVTTGPREFRQDRKGKLIEKISEGKWRVEYPVAGEMIPVITDIGNIRVLSPVVEQSPETRTQAPPEAVDDRTEAERAEDAQEAAEIRDLIESDPELKAKFDQIQSGGRFFARGESEVEHQAKSAQEEQTMQGEGQKEVDWDKCMKAMRYDLEYLGPPPKCRIVGRARINGERNYVVLEDGEEVPRFYPGTTSVVDSIWPKARQLFQWAVDKFASHEDYMEYLNAAAAKGSIMHGAVADLANGSLPDFSDADAWFSYMDSQAAFQGDRYRAMAQGWAVFTQKAVLSFMQFCKHYRVRILALEIPLRSRKSRHAGQIDLIVEMDSHIQGDGENSREPHRIVAVIDMKSTGAHDHHVAQLAMYGELVYENFPALKGKVQRYFIWSPKDWTGGEATYTLTNLTKKVAAYMKDVLPLDLKRYMLTSNAETPTMLTMVGKPEIGNDPSELFSYTTYEDHWMNRIKEGRIGSDT